MPITPEKGEKRWQFMDKCMHEITHKSKKKRSHEQRLAICLGQWAKHTNEDAILNRLDLLLGEEKQCPEGQKY